MSFLQRVFGKKGEAQEPDGTDEPSAKLKRCYEMMAQHREEEAIPLLNELRSALRSSIGSESKRMEGVAAGCLGTCLFETLQAEKALECYEEASRSCSEAQDEEGVRVHLSNRIETLRWLGRHQDAVPLAEQLAGMLETSGDEAQAARYRSRARIMARGEPLLRTLIAIDGRTYEEDEAPVPIQGGAQILLERNRITLSRCEARVEEGGRHVGQNRSEQAFACFESATRLDPHAPHPHYEAAAIHVRSGRYDEAIERFEETERLAPGWFTVRSELWLARQLAAGRFHPRVPDMLLLIEGMPPPTAVKQARELTDRFPDLPQAWLFLGGALRGLGRDEEAMTSYRRALACAEDEDTRTRALTSLGAGQGPAGRAELEEAAALNGHLVSGAVARLLLRSHAGQG